MGKSSILAAKQFAAATALQFISSWLEPAGQAAGASVLQDPMIISAARALLTTIAGVIVNLTSGKLAEQEQENAATLNHHLQDMLAEVALTALTRTQAAFKRKEDGQGHFPKISQSPCFAAWKRILTDARGERLWLDAVVSSRNLQPLFDATNPYVSADSWWDGVELSLRMWLARDAALPRGSSLPSLPADLGLALKIALPGEIQSVFAEFFASESHAHGRLSAQRHLNQQTAANVQYLRQTIDALRREQSIFLTSIHSKLDLIGGLLDPSTVSPDHGFGSWIFQGPPDPTRAVGNGLEYRVYKVRHKTKRDRIARAKRYDNAEMIGMDPDLIEAILLRHADTCDRLADCPYIATNLQIEKAGQSWWVVDRWIDGPTLTNRVRQGPLSAAEIASISRDLLAAIAQLHAAFVICRSLNPASIVLQHPGTRPVLTDFELAKFTDGAFSVARHTRLTADPFRAPEVSASNPSIKPQADLFSWAAIVLFMDLRKAAAQSRDWEAFTTSSSLPSGVLLQVKRCLHPAPRQRPASAAELQRTLANWK